MDNLQLEDRGGGLKLTFLVATILAIISQIKVSLFISDFDISIAIILFPLLLYIFDDLNIIRTAILTALFVYVLKVSIHAFNYGSVVEGITTYFPEIFFYIYYGIFFKMYKKFDPTLKLKYLFIGFLGIDYFSNLVELTIRTDGHIFQLKLQLGLIGVAIVRSFLVWVALYAMEYYNIFLLRKEHEDRYKKLLSLTSKLKSEMFWMEKNMHHIESTMTEAYTLFENIKKDKNYDTWASSALNIARDIHEVKKEYGLVVRGLQEAVENNLHDEGMYFNELVSILKSAMESDGIISDDKIKFSFILNQDFFTNKHYYLMSIFRNIITNSIEAMKNRDEEDIDRYIRFTHEYDKVNHIFIIEDNAGGIKKKYLESIFHPGFSTKINYDTGEINRGLGLSLVRDIVQENLNGKIEVISEEDLGTKFIITIPKEELEG